MVCSYELRLRLVILKNPETSKTVYFHCLPTPPYQFINLYHIANCNLCYYVFEEWVDNFVKVVESEVGQTPMAILSDRCM